MVHLKKLLQYDGVVVQCHNIPDVDTVATGFALYCFFRDHEIPVRLVYAGPAEISKPNIVEFIRMLQIPIVYIGREVKHVEELMPNAQRPLLVMADCQHGAGNVDVIACDTVCVLDHHVPEKTLPKMSVVKPYLGSCATVVWQMLKTAKYNVKDNIVVSTALYYGLYTDTNSLSELYHPIDRDMLEHLNFDKKTIQWLKHNNLTRDELLIAGNALIEARHNEELCTSLFMAKPCDPNILGFINDLSMQVKGVSVCVGFNEISHGIKLSIRSVTHEVMANELAAFLTKDLGSGGGNHEKAGGFMRPPEDQRSIDYLTQRLQEYYTSYDTVMAGVDTVDINAMQFYKKSPVTVGYVVLTDVFPVGTNVLVRTLEGDANFTVSEESYVIIGVKGEAFPIAKERFKKTYKPLEGAFSFKEEHMHDAFYHPTAKDLLYEKSVDLIDYIRPCLANEQSFVYAKPVVKNTKVFVPWFGEGYMLGEPGDYIAVDSDDPNDVFIVAEDIFPLTYECVH